MEQRNLIGETILGYEVVAQIGSGAFGTVYKVVKSNILGEYVRALKHITLPTKSQYISVLNSMGGDARKADNYFAEMLNGIASEISLLSRLSEKRTAHIVRYFESDLEIQEVPLRYDVYMLMEYATPLMDFIEQTSVFTIRDVLNVGLDVLEGIRVCHENGVIHRDIKEDNIFVSSEGDYEIGDFGVSKVLKNSSRAESLKGTPNYLAPEVYLNEGGYTKSVDLYALGIVLYRMLNHWRNPFMPPYPNHYFAEDEDKAFEKRMRGLPAPRPALGSDCIHRVVLKAISGENDRYKDASSFIADLTDAMAETPYQVLKEPIDDVLLDEVEKDATSESNAQTMQTIKIGIGPIATNETERTSYKNDDDAIKESCESSFESTNADKIGATSDENAVGETMVSNVHKDGGLSGTSEEVTDCHPERRTYKDAQTNEIIQDERSTIRRVLVISVIATIITFFISPVLSVIGLLCSFAALIGLLFFTGRSIHGRGEATSVATMVDNEPYMVVSDARFAFSSTDNSLTDSVVTLCLRELECLEDRLGSEAKFGYGDAQVTICENEIADCLKQIAKLASVVTGEGQKLEELRRLISQTQHLLDKRRTLLKR